MMILQWTAVAATVIGGAWNQYWPKLAPDAVSYAQASNVWVCKLDPLTMATWAHQQVNLPLPNQQDEPEIAKLVDGTYVIVWSDRSALYTQYMQVVARRYDANMVPIGGEFEVTDCPTTAFRPLIEATPTGWATFFTENWNEDSVIQAFDLLGNRLGPKVTLHPPSGANQNSPDATWFRGRWAWVFNENNNRHVVGACTKTGTPLRFTSLPGATFELRIDSNDIAFASVWCTNDFQQPHWVVHRSSSGVETVLGLGTGCEIDLANWGGIVTWADGGNVYARELDPNGELVGQQWTVWLGPQPLLPTQPDVLVAPDRTYALFSYGVQGQSTMDGRVERWQP